MPGRPVSPKNDRLFWKLWNRLTRTSQSNIVARRHRSIDAFELEERILLSATPAPTEQSSNNSTNQTSSNTSNTTQSQTASTPQTANNQSSSAQGVSVVLIDTHLKDSGLLVQSVPRDAQLFLYNSQYDSAHDVLSRVSNWAESTGQKISTLSILGQGHDGAFQLGSDWISSSTLQGETSDWLRLAQSMTSQSKIDLFGGMVDSQSGSGQQLLDQIAQLTGADVFASTNKTGSGGDWTLEATSSNSTSQFDQQNPLDSAVLQRYSGTLNSGAASSSNDEVDARSQIVFVDSSIQNLQDLIRNIPPDSEIVFIDSFHDGMDQMVQVLAGRHNLTSIAILSHGTDARLILGTSNVTLDSLQSRYVDDWAVVRDSLASNAQILLYGCDIAEFGDGRALIDAIAMATKASVAASTNLTGSSLLKGDWNLEYSTGSISDQEMRDALMTSNWDYLLTTATFQQGSSSYSGATDTMVDSSATGADNGSALTLSANLLGTTQDLVKFDLSSIPAGSTITGVQLSFTSAATIGLLPSVNLYKMLVPWTSSANWNSFGGGGVPRDNVTASSSSDASFSALLTLGGTATFSSANMVSTVQSWVNTPTNNNGWLVVGGGLATVSFYSSDTGSTANRPLLTVTYTAPTSPSVDLDANNSSGSTGNNFNTSFTQHGAAIKVADTDGTVTAGTNSISPNLLGMTITISNLLDGAAESLSASTTGTSISASYNSATGVLTLSGSDTSAHYQTVLRSVTYNNTADNISTASRVINVVATDPYGGNSATATTTVSIIANTPPTITNGATVTLTGTNEDTTSSGTSVNAILTAANWSDPDAGTLKGIAITGKAGNGTWQYSTDGTTWANVGNVSSTNALLLTSTTQVRYVPDALNGETATCSFMAWDQTSGTASTNSTPSYVNPGSGGGTTAYSSQSATASMTVTSVNDAPTITNGAIVVLTGTDEDTTSTTTTVGSILTSAGWNDVDTGAIKGIAVTGKVGNGTWQYSTDGTTWTNFGAVSGTNALLLTSTTQVRYVPDGQNGETATFSFVAWDQSSGTASTNSTPGYANPGSGGGTSAYSSQSASASMSITSVNDAPSLTNGSVVTLTGTNEDATSPATSVNSILTSAGWGDVDIGTLKGIAITAKTGNGTWQYSTDGITWNAFGSITATNSLLLTSGSQVRYIPDGQNGETATFSFVAWDQTTGTASTNATPRYANPGSGGGTSAFSSQSASASMTITSVNDAPTMTNGATVTLTGTNEDTPSSATSINATLTAANWADGDIGALKGIAVTGQIGNGTWQYSTDGVTWTGFGSVSATNALLLTSGSQVRYLPDGQNGETANFTFVAWDQTSGTASINGTPGYANPGSGGGTTAYSSQSASASITVTSVNDAPTINNGSTVILSGTNENTTSTTSSINAILSSAGWNDVDIGALKGIAVTGQVGNGTWQYSTDGVTWANFGSVSATNALLLTSTSQVRYVPDGQNGETATFSFVAWDQTSGTASTNAVPRYANPGSGGGTSAFSSQSASASMTISDVNNAPSITNGAIVTLAGTDEDTPSSSTSVNTILTTANWIDVDHGAVKGIAITAKAGNGTWQYSTDGTTWTNFGTISATNALLLTSSSFVRYVPDSQNGETATFAFVAWDQTTGSASTAGSPGYANPGSGGGTTAFSSQSASSSIVVTSVNDAPTITNGTTVILTGTNEDATSPATTVNSILTSAGWADVDLGALKGIAITASTGNGTWQYSTDGATWTSFGAVSSSNALLATSASQIRYVPDGQNGETATFSFVAWDQTSGAASANGTPQYATPGAGGGTSAFSNQSATASMTISSVNDAPTITNGATVVLAGTNEDTTSPGTTVDSLLSSAGWGDVDLGALKGIAVTSKTGNGTWQYSTDGATWTSFGSVSSSNALLMAATAQVRYVPDGQNGETATFSFVAWDQTSGPASTNGTPRYANPGSGGGTTAYSSQSATTSMTVTPVNDAPTITNGLNVTLTPTNEKTTSPSTTINSILSTANWADVDLGALKGLAITGASGNGTWQYSTDGTTWTNFGAVSITNALLITSSTQVRYVPDQQNGEAALFTFEAWDQTSGTASTNATPNYADASTRGGTTAFSSQSASASITVASINDAPTITNGAGVALAGTDEDTTSSATSVNSILGSAGWADVDNGALKGIAITGKTGNGTWQYSTDGVTWANFGTVTSSNALLMTSGTQVRYIPDGKNGETATFSFVAWDQTTGTASTNSTPSYANPASGGGSTAFSSQSASVSMTVTSVNDAPTITNGANVLLTGTNEDTISSATSVNSILTSASVADVDTGALRGMAITGATGNGTWQYSTDGTTWTNLGTVSLNNSLLLTSTSQLRYVPDGKNGETATFTFVAWDRMSGTGSANGAPSYADASVRGGTTAFSTGTASASMTVTSVNDAATITNGAVVTLPTTNEDTISSPTTVDSILTSANWNDVDTGALKGIAITGKTGNGTWQYSTDGTTWTNFGATSSSNALLLTASTQVRYLPDNQNGENATFTFVAWDQTSGTASANGTPRYANPGSGGGTTAFSAQLATASLSVTSVNDAPTILNGANIPLVGTDLLTISSSTSVNALLSAANWADVDLGSLKGIAVTSQTGHGTWQYSTDGATWNNFGSVSTSNALLLTSTSQVRYIPDGLTIELPKFTFVAWDQTSGTASTNTTANYGNATTRGGTTAYSSQTASASMIISLLSNQSVTLPSTDEDTPSPGTTANTILMDSSWSSINIGLLGGLAITDQSGNGTWQYSTNGVTWSNFGNVSATNALVISSSTQVRYLPDGQNGETAGFVFQAWNQLTGPASTNSTPQYQDTNVNLLNFSTQSSTASLTVTSVNDAPTLTNVTSSLPGTNEDTASSAATVDSMLTSAGWDDVDIGALKGIAVTGATGNGTWQYSTDGVQWTNISGISTSNALLLDSSAKVRYLPDGLNGETSTLTFVAWDQTQGTSSTNAAPQYANTLTRGGTTAFSLTSAIASLEVDPVNDAPTLTSGSIGSIGDTNQFTNSTAVSADTLLTAASWFDPDIGAQKGIAITGTSGNGTWQYSVDGTTWTNVGSVSATNALLLTDSTLIHYVPDGANSETATLSFVAWDQSSGTASTNVVPSYDDATPGGGTSAFSSQSASGIVTVTAINRAPTITNGGTATLAGTDEDTPSPPTSIATILSATGYNDADGSSLQGIAVTSQTGNGTWQYSTDGTTWTNFGSTTTNNSLLLDSNTLVRYMPDQQNGETVTFGFVAWDQTSGVPSGDGVPAYANTSSTGGTTAFSSQSASATLLVTSVNDAPTIMNGAIVTLPGTDEHAPSTATSVDSILTSANWSDVDNGALKGIAVTGTTGTGTWQYSTDGSTWTNFGTVGSNNALLVSSSDQIRYVPNGQSAETATFSFIAWDRSTGTASANGSPSYANPIVRGGTSAYSSQSAAATLTVTWVNDAPTIQNGAIIDLPGTNQLTPSSPTSIDSILTSAGWSDPDYGAQKGIAVTSVTADGTWQYSTDGTTWTNFGTVSTTNALLLDSNAQVRYVPDGIHAETASFQFVAWDQTTGAASSAGNAHYANSQPGGGTSAYSSQVATAQSAVVRINAAPTITNGADVSLIGTNEDTSSSPTSIDSILTAANWSDGNIDAVKGIAVISATGNGNWQYSTDGVSWTNFGTVSSSQALLLASSSLIRYQPDGMNGESANFQFLAWDQTSGTPSANATPSIADASATGGTTAYSSQLATASINVTSVNDAPTLTNGTTVTLPTTDEDTTSSATNVGSILTSANVHDVDFGAVYGMAITSTSGNGTWQYSTDGTTWTALGSVSTSHALLLDSTSLVRYVPDGKNGEVASFSFVAWDQSTGTASTNAATSYGNTSPAGGVTAYSTQSASATINVTSVNDAPTITNGAVVTLTSTDRITPSTNTVVDSILTTANWSDPDFGALKGIAITGQTGHGTWQYSTDGTTWNSFGSTSTSNALLLTSSTSIRYSPDGVTTETASFTFVAWDQTSGIASTNSVRSQGDATVVTPTGAFSSQSATATMAVDYVNKAPTIASTTVTLPSTNDTTTSSKTSVDSLLTAVNWSDDGPGGLKGIAVTSTTGSGTWKYSSDGVTWVDFGNVSATHALLLTSNQWVAYVPKANVSDQAAFAFRGWDQSTGVASTNGTASFANPGAGGGTTAFTTIGQTSTATIGVSSNGVSIITPPTNDPNPTSGSNNNSNGNSSGGSSTNNSTGNPKDTSNSTGNTGSGVTSVPPYLVSTSTTDHHWPSTGTSILINSNDDTWGSVGSSLITANSNFIAARATDTTRIENNPYRGTNVLNIGYDQTNSDSDQSWVPVVHHPVIVARVDGQRGPSRSTILGSASAVSSTLTAGYVLWLLRGGSLWGGMVSLISSWSTVDPLPILESAAAVTDKEKEDRETLQSLITQGGANHQKPNSKS